MTRKVDGERRCRRERVEDLAKGVWGDHLVVGGDELVEFNGKEI